MRKTIAVLVVLLLTVGSAQAVTVLMDENFDAYGGGTDPAVVGGSGWVKNSGSGRIVTVSGMGDGGSVAANVYHDGDGTAKPASYSYALSDVTLGAGESYRFEGYMAIPGAGNEEMIQLELIHSDDRVIQFIFENDGDLTQDTIEDQVGWNNLARQRVNLTPQTSVRVALDIDALGITSWYDIGSGWVELGQSLATSDPLLGFTGGLTEFRMRLYTNSYTVGPTYVDTLGLTVEGAGGSAIPGDFDADNDVDGVDFGLWQSGYPTASGASLINGDADADGDVDGVDFGIWQANYPTNLGGAAAIPEPATICLLALAGTVLLARKRR